MVQKVFRQMTIAQILSGIAAVLCLLIDSIMIGRFLGVDAIAAYGLSNPLLLSFVAIASMISAGVQVVCSKTLGSGDKNETNAMYSTTIVTSLAIGLAGVFLVVLFRGLLSQLLGAGGEGELHDLTSDYLLGFIIGAPAVLIVTVLIPFLQFSGKQSVLVVAVIALTISDVSFDLLSVFVFKGGMLGMGLASSFSYYVALVIGAFYFFGKDCIFKFSIKQANFRRCRTIFKNGIPTIINMVSLVLLSFALNRILMAIADKNAVAAYSIISTASNICYSFSSGIGAVTLMLAGIYYYEDDKKSISEIFSVMIKKEIIVNLIVPIIACITAPFIVLLFMSNDNAAYDMAVLGLRLFALSLFPSAINTGLKNFYQGTNRIRLTEFISVFQNFLFIALSAFILGNLIGTNGVWISYLCGELLTFLFICLNVYRFKRSLKFKFENYSLIPDDFGVSDDCFLRETLHSLEDVNAFSVKAYDFCERNNASQKCCTYTSLCIEELCNNIVSYGFDKKKDNNISVSLFLKYPDMIIRIRDDSKEFDPIEYYNLVSSEDITSHIGIRMVLKLANEVRYTNSMSQNSISLYIKASDF